jgi:hypothetical protein
VDVVQIYYLLVGHTHGQIDQFFSNFATYLKMFPPRTLPELLYGLWYSYNNPDSLKKIRAKKAQQRIKTVKTHQEEVKSTQPKRVVAELIDQVADVDSWLDSLLDKTHRDFVLLQDNHGFQLTRDEVDPNVVNLQYKNSAGDPDWRVFFFFVFFF